MRPWCLRCGRNRSRSRWECRRRPPWRRAALERRLPQRDVASRFPLDLGARGSTWLPRHTARRIGLVVAAVLCERAADVKAAPQAVARMEGTWITARLVRWRLSVVSWP